MKKTFQVERDLSVDAKSTRVFTLTLQEAYAKCKGFFLTKKTAGGTDFSKLTIGLTVAQQEVLPLGTDAALFAVSEYVSRLDAMYDMADENIPARSSDVTLTVTNNGSTLQTFNVYFALSNV